MLIDLHVHSSRTPGCSIEPAQAVARAESIGLDGICFTDLDTLDRAKEIHALRASTKIAVLVGMEVETDHGRFLCFFPKPEELRVEEVLGTHEVAIRRPARDVLESVLAMGGAVVAAHPYDRDLEKPMGDFIFTLRNLTAVEGIAGTRGSNVNELAIESADHLSLPCVGGSAAMKSCDEIGTAATLFKDSIHDEAGLVEALRGGSVWAVAVGTPPRFHGDNAALREPRERHPREGYPREGSQRDGAPREGSPREGRGGRSGDRRGGRRGGSGRGRGGGDRGRR